jgi:ABC-type branched-subunit amino acid transport system ATPase component
MFDESSEGISTRCSNCSRHEGVRDHGSAGEQNVELALDIADCACVLDQGAVIYQAAAS